MASAEWKSETLECPTGARLHLYSSLAMADNAKGIVHINHGMGEHAGRYQGFAEFLNANGYHVYAHDHRGHGQTHAEGTVLGHFGKDGWDAVIADVDAVNTHIKVQHSALPIICFGHSMGAIIAFNYVLRHPNSIAAAAIWNAGFDTGILAAVYGLILRTERFFKGSDVPSQMAYKLTFAAWNKEFAPNRTDFDWLSRDEAEVDKYIADTHCGFDIMIALWLDVLKGVYFGADDNNLKALPKDLPFNLIGGEKDPCGLHGKAAQNLASRLTMAGFSNVLTQVLPDTRHECLNEINRDETMVGFVQWLDAKVVAK